MSDLSQAINQVTGLPEVHIPVPVPKTAQQLADHVAPLVNLIPQEVRLAYVVTFLGHLMGMLFHAKK